MSRRRRTECQSARERRTEDRKKILNHKDTKDTKKIQYIGAETKKIET